jgi:hypothetical protein
MSDSTKSLIAKIGSIGGVALLAVAGITKLIMVVGSLITALSTILPIIAAFAAGIGGLVTVAAAASVSLGILATKVIGLWKATKEATEAQELNNKKTEEGIAVWDKYSTQKLESMENERKAYKLANMAVDQYTKYVKLKGDELSHEELSRINGRIKELTTFYNGLNIKEEQRTEKEKVEQEKRQINGIIDNEENEVIQQEHYDKLVELKQQLENQINDIGLEGLHKSLRQIQREKDAKLDAYKTELAEAKDKGLKISEAEKRLSEYKVKVNYWAESQSGEVRDEYRKKNVKDSYDATQKIIDYTLKSFEVTKDTTAQEVRMVQSLIVAQKSLAVARLWAAEASKGILGLATAVVGTVSIMTTLNSESDKLKKNWRETKSEIEKPIMPELIEPDFDMSPEISPAVSVGGISQVEAGDTAGRAVSRRKTAAGAGVVNVSIATIQVILNVDSLENLQSEKLENQLKQIANSVKDKTVEGIKMATTIGDEIQRQEGMA